MMNVLPGDPVLSLVGERYDEQTLQKIRHDLGLDRPLAERYIEYLGRVARMDLGRSFATGRPVTESIAERFPRTLMLAGAAMIIAVAGGLAAGLMAAAGRPRWTGRVLMTISLVGVSIPVFWLGLLLIQVFSIRLGMFPPSGYGGGSLRYLVLPALTLSFASMATVARVTRSGLIETGAEDFVRTARAKGLGDGRVIVKHVLRNALIPVVTIVGTDFGSYLSGSVLNESIFGWHGLGRLIVQSILRRDFPVIQGGILFMAVVFVIVNLIVDVSYGFIDPRVRKR